MSGVFYNRPKAPAAPVTPPPAPTMSNSIPQTDAAAQQVQMQLDRGRTSTVLNGGAGLSDLGDTTSKKLLGQ